MTSGNPRRLVPAPFPSHDDSIPMPESPASGISVLRSGIKRASTACQSCKHIKRKCDQRQPCFNCLKIGVECIFDLTQDGRRRAARKRNVEELELKRDALETILDAFRTSDDDHAQHLLRMIRSSAPLGDVVQYATAHESELPPGHLTTLATAVDHSLPRRAVLSITALCDTPFVRVSAVPWTSVKVDDDLVSHLVSVYFTWCQFDYPAVDQDLFVRDMTAGNLDCLFCSPLLVNAMLALACHFSDHPRTCSVMGDQSTRGEHFLTEAVRLWNVEEGRPTTCNVQAGQLISITLTVKGKDRVGYGMLGQLTTMADELIIKNRRPPANSTVHSETRRSLCRALWSLYLVHVGMGLAFMRPTVAEQPKIGQDFSVGTEPAPATNWTPYPSPDPKVNFDADGLFRANCDLHTIGADIQGLVFARGDAGRSQDVETHVRHLEARLDKWRVQLAPAAQLPPEDHCVSPPVIDLHLVYHWFRANLFHFAQAPMVKGPLDTKEETFAQRARSHCLSSAKAVAYLASQYIRDFGLKNFTFWMPQSALSTAHMLVDQLEDPQTEPIFHTICLVLTTASRRWLVMKGHVRMLFLTATQKGHVISARTKDLLRYVALEQWAPKDHLQFTSSVYPNYALARSSEDPLMAGMGDLLERWADLHVDDSNEALDTKPQQGHSSIESTPQLTDVELTFDSTDTDHRRDSESSYDSSDRAFPSHSPFMPRSSRGVSSPRKVKEDEGR